MEQPTGANVGGVLVQDGWDVYSADDEKVGTIAEAHPGYLLVEKGWLFKKDLYIPMSAVRDTQPERGCVVLSVYKDQVETMGWDSMPLETTGATAERGASDTGTMQLREEQLTARKAQEQAGEVEIGKHVVEEERTLDVPVTHDEVEIEHRPVEPRPADGDISERTGETVRVPLMKEEVDVQKRPVVREEVNVHKTPVTENQTVTDTVRREEAVVDKRGAVEGAGRERVHEHRFVSGVCADCGERQ